MPRERTIDLDVLMPTEGECIGCGAVIAMRAIWACAVMSDDGYFCSRARDHDGPHVAVIGNSSSPRHEDHLVCDEWPGDGSTRQPLSG